MINDKKLFLPLFTPRNICCGYLLESPRQGDSNKYPQHMFLGVLNTLFLNISNYLPYLELRNHSIQIVVITNFDVIFKAGIKGFDCTSSHTKNIQRTNASFITLTSPYVYTVSTPFI